MTSFNERMGKERQNDCTQEKTSQRSKGFTKSSYAQCSLPFDKVIQE